MVTGETVTGRDPYQRPFSFAPNAAHWFAGNHYLTPRDVTEGFWRRWLIFRFWVGKAQDQRDPTLFDRIIETKLPAIVAWAFQGEEMLVERGFQETMTQRVCLKEWQDSYDNVTAWLNASDGGVRVSTEGKPILTDAAFNPNVCFRGRVFAILSVVDVTQWRFILAFVRGAVRLRCTL